LGGASVDRLFVPGPTAVSSRASVSPDDTVLTYDAAAETPTVTARTFATAVTVALLTIASAVTVVVANNCRGKINLSKRTVGRIVRRPIGARNQKKAMRLLTTCRLGVAMTEPPRYEPPQDDNFDIDEPLDDDEEEKKCKEKQCKRNSLRSLLLRKPFRRKLLHFRFWPVLH
jgi:hypothetical protein